jgi:hypothetical protein
MATTLSATKGQSKRSKDADKPASDKSRVIVRSTKDPAVTRVFKADKKQDSQALQQVQPVLRLNDKEAKHHIQVLPNGQEEWITGPGYSQYYRKQADRKTGSYSSHQVYHSVSSGSSSSGSFSLGFVPNHLPFGFAHRRIPFVSHPFEAHSIHLPNSFFTPLFSNF